jgi:eukaryotic-like serine/threonine-protein kinase
MVATTSRATADPPLDGRSRYLVFGEFSFDSQSRLLRRGQVELPVPPRVLGVLELLLDRAGDVVPRQELIDSVWKDAFVTDTSLAEAVSVLRQTLGDDPQNPVYLQTVHRRGYRFVAPVTTIEPASPASPRMPEVQSKALSDRVSPSIGGQLIPWSAAALCAAVAIAAVWQLVSARDSSAPPTARFAISPAAGTKFDHRAPALTMSADGRQIAWSGCDAAGCRLYLRTLNALDARALAGTDGAHAPFFSTDGQWIAFFADGRLKKVAIGGGEPVILADTPEAVGGTWDGRDIIFAASTTSGLMRVSERGGAPELLTTPAYARGEVRHSWPSIVPGSRLLLFTIETTRGGEPSGDLAVLRLDGGQASWRTVVSGIGLARAAAADLIVFSRGNELQAVPFDPLRVTVAGEARTLVTNVATADGRAHFALSASGDLLFAEDAARGAEPLAWWSPAGMRDVGADARRFRSARLSPDGSRIAAIGAGDSRPDVWIADLTRGAATRLTHERVNSSPVWSPDGRTIYFASRTGEGPFEIWSSDAEAATPLRRLLRLDSHAFPGSAAPDGSALAIVVVTPRSGTDIVLLPLGSGDARPLIQSPFDDDAPAFSPDGLMLAYQSADTGRWQVYVQRLSDSRRLMVSTAGGDHPVWSPDGTSLYYRSEGGVVRVALSQAAEGPKVGEASTVSTPTGNTIAGVAPDGRILIDPRGSVSPTRAVMTMGWVREARQLLGPPALPLPR